MEIRIDRQRCQGHARCASEAPDVFDLDERGYSVVRLTGRVPPEQEAEARRGAAACPERAVHIVEGET